MVKLRNPCMFSYKYVLWGNSEGEPKMRKWLCYLSVYWEWFWSYFWVWSWRLSWILFIALDRAATILHNENLHLEFLDRSFLFTLYHPFKKDFLKNIMTSGKKGKEHKKKKLEVRRGQSSRSYLPFNSSYGSLGSSLNLKTSLKVGASFLQLGNI